ncbi:MAG TPA: CBS domain-containing protein, partial [Candidatus Binataceae bacterium]
MSDQDDNVDRLIEEEMPGPADLESALAHDMLSDVATHPALFLESSTTVSEAINRMREHRRGCALVVEDGLLVGIFTERDVLMRIAGRSINVEESRIDSFMTRDPVTLPPDSSVAFALNLMALEGFRHIPLVDDSGRPLGVVSMRNLIEYLSEFYQREVLTL